jgi:hypothetical protein
LSKLKKETIKNYFDEFNKKYIIPEDYILNENGFNYKNGPLITTLSAIPFFIDFCIVNGSKNIALKIIYFDDKLIKRNIIIPLYQTGYRGMMIKPFRSKGITIDSINEFQYIRFFSEFWNLNYELVPRVTSKSLGDIFLCPEENVKKNMI